MKLGQRYLSRRKLIKALGAIGALSIADMKTLLAAPSTETTTAPLRLLILVQQHGWGFSPDISNENHKIKFNGNEFVFPSIVNEMNTIADKMSIVNYLFHARGWGNAHDVSYADILTGGVYCYDTSSSFNSHLTTSVKPSVDYIIEEITGKEAFRFSAGYRSWGAPYHPLSFDRNGTLIEQQTTAKAAYDKHFASVESGSENSSLENNLFSYLKTSATRRRNTLTVDEQGSLDQYLASIDKVKKSTTPITGYSGKLSLPFNGKTKSSEQSHLENFEDFLEMAKVGFANNMTNVAVIGIRDAGNLYNIEDFHEQHAHANDNIYWQTRSWINQYLVNFVNEINAIEDFDGRTLLDNTIIMTTGEIQTGSHSHKYITPIIGGGGRIPLKRVFTPERAYFRDNPGGMNTNYPKDVWIREFGEDTFYGRNHRDGNSYSTVMWDSKTLPTRTHADLWREILSLYGSTEATFGLSEINRGSVLF